MAFLELAPELRNAIYTVLITNEHCAGIVKGRLQAPALARTCRQIRSEFLPLYESLTPLVATRFKTSVTDFDLTGLVDFMQRLPPDARGEKRTVEIDVHITPHGDRDLTSFASWLQWHKSHYIKKAKGRPLWTDEPDFIEVDWNVISAQGAGKSALRGVSDKLKDQDRAMPERRGTDGKLVWESVQYAMLIYAIGTMIYNGYEVGIVRGSVAGCRMTG